MGGLEPHRGARSLVAAAALATVLAGCGGSSSGTRQSITLYNGQYVQTTNLLVRGFEQATGITVRVRSNEEAPLANQIVIEGKRSPADVIFTENSPALEYLQGKGLLAPVAPATLARTPAWYDSPRGTWVGVSARASVLIYNPSLIAADEVPGSALQLASPRYRGKLAVAPAEPDFLPIVTSVERTVGKAATLRWLQGIRDNAGNHVYADNEAVVTEVNRGIAALGVVEGFYWYRLRAELGAAGIHTKIAYFAPRDPGFVVGVSGAAILASSKHQAAAQRFLAFLVSDAGRKIIASSLSYEYVFGGAAKGGQTPLGRLQPSPITVQQMGDGSGALALLRTVGLL